MAKQQHQSTTSDSNLMAALSYLWILSVVMLLVKKDDSYVYFHAKQGLVIFLISLILWFIPLLGWLMQFLVVLAVISGFVQALSGKKWRMPLVADLADKITL